MIRAEVPAATPTRTAAGPNTATAGPAGTPLPGRGTGECEVAEVNEMPVRHASIDGGVLVHRRNDDAVCEFQVSNPEW